MKTSLLFKNGKAVKWVGAIMLIAFALFMGYQLVFQLPKAQKAEDSLTHEFDLIPPFPNAAETEHSASHKTSTALVDSNYISNSAPRDIFGHYDEALSENGWSFYQTSTVLDWNRDLGGWSAVWCKGDYGATLQYAGDNADYGWTFAFDMAWGLQDCEPVVPIGNGGLVKLDLLDACLLLIWGSGFLFVALSYSVTAWRMTADEYKDWREQLGFKNRVFRLSNSYVLWNDRLVSILGVIMGIVFALVGLIEIVLNFKL